MILHTATLVFVVLKAVGYIAWSWWIVFAPSILALALFLVSLFVMGGLMGLTIWKNK